MISAGMKTQEEISYLQARVTQGAFSTPVMGQTRSQRQHRVIIGRRVVSHIAAVQPPPVSLPQRLAWILAMTLTGRPS